MLFIAHKPTQLLITKEDKIIMTTNKQVYFTYLHFIEEYLSTQLCYPSPKSIVYSSEQNQTVIET